MGHHRQKENVGIWLAFYWCGVVTKISRWEDLFLFSHNNANNAPWWASSRKRKFRLYALPFTDVTLSLKFQDGRTHNVTQISRYLRLVTILHLRIMLFDGASSRKRKRKCRHTPCLLLYLFSLFGNSRYTTIPLHTDTTSVY